MKYSLKILALCAALFVPSLKANADVTYTIDSSLTWQGFMNVFELPENLGGYVFGSGWGVPDLVSVFDNTAHTLTLAPNSVNDPNPFWYTPSGGPGSTGNKIMDANTYIELPVDTVGGQTVTFEGTVLSNSLTSSHVARAFIRDFVPNYSSYTETSYVLTPGPFSISLLTDPGAGRHVQYGFNFNGPNVWITDVAPYGNVVLQTVSTAGTPGDFNDDGLVDGRDFLLWQQGGSPTSLSASDLADWQTNYGTGGLAAVSVVPEPATISLFAAVAGLVVLRRASR